MIRDVNVSFTDEYGELHYFTKRENHHRKDVYKKALNICCWPDCPSGYKLAVHHILPLKKDGTDDYLNYIVLCEYCHLHHRLHQLCYKNQLNLLVYKFYQEKLVLGFCSDEMSNDSFETRCRQFVSQCRKVEQARPLKNDSDKLVNNLTNIVESSIIEPIANKTIQNQHFIKFNLYDKNGKSMPLLKITSIKKPKSK